ncbi:MAG TPA: hypothetical protein PLA87_02280 [Pseudomonadota bacterium]|nr:hypothetical protein [Pseudomonadota bacterium]
MKEVLHNDYFILSLDVQSSVVTLVRTQSPFPTVKDVETEYQRISTAMDRLGRRSRYLRIDLRDAPGRNDPAFEAIMNVQRPRLFATFRRVAVLVKTSVGTLQVRRHTRQDGFAVFVSSTPDEVEEYLVKGT